MKHSNDEFRALALHGEILRTEVGSGAHGIAIEGQDDRDEMGICIEPPEFVIGLRKFEQYIYRTQLEGARSGPGDLDLVIYSLRKWMRLALAGNPTVLVPLFAPDVLRPYELLAEIGQSLQARPEMIVSRQAGHRFIGYLRSQREQLLGLRGMKKTNRPELIEKYGYDTKFAGHMVRLGFQGVELLETGRITLPMPEPERVWIKAMRVGEVPKQDALDRAEELEARLNVLVGTSPLPDHPDMQRVNNWLTEVYYQAWSAWGIHPLAPQRWVLGPGADEHDEQLVADIAAAAAREPFGTFRSAGDAQAEAADRLRP